MRLQGQKVLVTGGGRGIGRTIALAMAREGADLIIAADVGTEVSSAVREIEGLGRRAMGHVLDITDSEQVNRFAESVENQFGKVNILVNNAGVVGKRFFVFQSDDAVWRRTIEVNLFGTYYCTKAFLPQIIEHRKGRIINIASISGK
jgi:3-oxoacyl-[acyl-carrier protein] reductase